MTIKLALQKSMLMPGGLEPRDNSGVADIEMANQFQARLQHLFLGGNRQRNWDTLEIQHNGHLELAPARSEK